MHVISGVLFHLITSRQTSLCISTILKYRSDFSPDLDIIVIYNVFIWVWPIRWVYFCEHTIALGGDVCILSLVPQLTVKLL